MVSSNDCKFSVYQHSFHVVKLYCEGLFLAFSLPTILIKTFILDILLYINFETYALTATPCG